MTGKVLKIGIGILGGEILHTLARAGVDEIIVACRDEETGRQKAAQVSMGAAAQGLYPDISYRKIDLNDVEGTTRILGELEPDMVFNSADFHPFWRFHTDLPREVASRFGEGGPVGYSLALPFRLLLPFRLMKAVKASGIDTHVLLTNDPCEIVNPMLAGAGMEPDGHRGFRPHRRAHTEGCEREDWGPREGCRSLPSGGLCHISPSQEKYRSP
jgi:hypothetical protein